MNITYADRVGTMNSSVVRETLKLTTKPDIISFAGGMPAPEVFPVEAMRRATDRVYREAGRTALQYGTTDGYLPLRQKIAERQRREGIDCTADDVLIISGSQQGLDLSGKIFLNRGDLVVCEDPTYTAALSAFRAYECGFLPIETDEDGMLLDDLREKLEKNPRASMIYVIPTFQNPTGRTWSLERRKGLLALAEEFGLPIVEDNPYGELRYEGEAIPPLKAMDKKGIVAYMGTFSKILCPGLRLGWITAPPDMLEKYNCAKQGADLQASTILQLVVDAYMEENSLDENIQSLNGLYRTRRDLMLEQVEAQFPEGTIFTRPKGGLFLWAAVPEEIDTAKAMPEAVARKVAYIPGHSFYASGGVTNTLRLNFSNASEEAIVKGMKIMGEVLREQLG